MQSVIDWLSIYLNEISFNLVLRNTALHIPLDMVPQIYASVFSKIV